MILVSDMGTLQGKNLPGLELKFSVLRVFNFPGKDNETVT